MISARVENGSPVTREVGRRRRRRRLVKIFHNEEWLEQSLLNTGHVVEGLGVTYAAPLKCWCELWVRHRQATCAAVVYRSLYPGKIQTFSCIHATARLVSPSCTLASCCPSHCLSANLLFPPKRVNATCGDEGRLHQRVTCMRWNGGLF